MNKANDFPYFFTATCLEWKHLLKPDKYKQIVIESLSFLVIENRVKVFGFVIMSNHLHIIWQILGENTREKVQLSFLRFTSQQIKFDLEKNHPKVLEHFKVSAKDRMYQFWERNSLSVEISTQHFFYQKLNYIHQNPVEAKLCNFEEDYYFSSAKFYERAENDFDFLTHYKE